MTLQSQPPGLSRTIAYPITTRDPAAGLRGAEATENQGEVRHRDQHCQRRPRCRMSGRRLGLPRAVCTYSRARNGTTFKNPGAAIPSRRTREPFAAWCVSLPLLARGMYSSLFLPHFRFHMMILYTRLFMNSSNDYNQSPTLFYF